MTLFTITTVETSTGTFAETTAALEVLFEAIDTTKTVRFIDMKQLGSDSFQGVIMHDT